VTSDDTSPETNVRSPICRSTAEASLKAYYSERTSYDRSTSKIERDGWVQVRMRGSHRQFRHSTKPGTVTVSGKPSVDVPPGTLNSVLKQAGLK